MTDEKKKTDRDEKKPTKATKRDEAWKRAEKAALHAGGNRDALPAMVQAIREAVES